MPTKFKESNQSKTCPRQAKFESCLSKAACPKGKLEFKFCLSPELGTKPANMRDATYSDSEFVLTNK